MITALHTIILGAVQGLSEFLPISSSGHLVLLPHIFNWHYQGLSFDVALHAGTAIAIVLFFWRDWLAILHKTFSKNTKTSGVNAYPKNIFWQIVVASIPAGLFGIFIDKYIENSFHSIPFISINFIFFGFLLWFIDKKAKTNLKTGELTYGKSFLIGLSQAIALIPGVSRSGITITASRAIGMPREDAARFSFLIATPAIVGAFLVKLPEIVRVGTELSFWLGIISATVFGFLAIKFLLNYLKKSDFAIFFWYRAILAVVALLVYFI